MSERDVLKRFWMQIASGVIILVLSGIGVIWRTQSSTISNKEEIRTLKEESVQYIKKDEHDRYYHVLIENIDKLENRMENNEHETTENYKEIINHLFEIKKEIQELHKK